MKRRKCGGIERARFLSPLIPFGLFRPRVLATLGEISIGERTHWRGEKGKGCSSSSSLNSSSASVRVMAFAIYLRGSDHLVPFHCQIVVLEEGGVVSNRKQLAFSPGQTVQGRIQIDLGDFELELLGIKVCLEGRAFAKFKDHQKNEHIFEVSSIIFGSNIPGRAGEENNKLSAGRHSFPFSLEIPSVGLAPSFSGSFGWIRYQISVYILRAPNIITKKTDKTFVLYGGPDLSNSSLEPKWAAPLTLFKCDKGLFTRRVTLEMKLELEKSAFSPGEEIRFSLMVSNATKEDLNAVISIVQKCNYRAASGFWKVVEKSVAFSNKESIDGVWTDMIVLPKNIVASFPEIIPESRTDGNSSLEITPVTIIDIVYFVRVKVGAFDNSKFLKVEAPLLIGRMTPTLTAGTPDAPPPEELEEEEVEEPLSTELFDFKDGSKPGPSSLPAYSTLSRSHSFETLPPHYEDALQEDETS